MATQGIELYFQNFRNDQFTIFGKQRKDLPKTDKIDKDFICLPIHENLTFEGIQYVINSVKAGW